MNGFFLAIGKQGEGKTAMTTKLLIDNYFESPNKRKVYSNYSLFGIDYIPIVKSVDPNKTYKKGTIGFLDQLIKDPNFFNGSIIAIDEIHLYFDSREFMKKHHKTAQTFFSQLRKRKILLLGTAQYLMNVDIRLRQQCSNVFDMSHVYKDLFEVVTCAIDGYFSEEVGRHTVLLNDYYKYYDTNEIISD